MSFFYFSKSVLRLVIYMVSSGSPGTVLLLETGVIPLAVIPRSVKVKLFLSTVSGGGFPLLSCFLGERPALGGEWVCKCPTPLNLFPLVPTIFFPLDLS